MKKLNKNQWIAVIVGVCVMGFFFVFGQNILSIFNNAKTMNGKASTQLGIQDSVFGTGDEATGGSRVTVNYVGHFSDGKIFDSSVSRNEPFQFVLGSGQVIEGWDKGIVGMHVGGKRTLTVPPVMGYGPNDYGPIPGNSTLIFDIELLKVEK